MEIVSKKFWKGNKKIWKTFCRYIILQGSVVNRPAEESVSASILPLRGTCWIPILLTLSYRSHLTIILSSIYSILFFFLLHLVFPLYVYCTFIIVLQFIDNLFHFFFTHFLFAFQFGEILLMYLQPLILSLAIFYLLTDLSNIIISVMYYWFIAFSVNSFLEFPHFCLCWSLFH